MMGVTRRSVEETAASIKNSEIEKQMKIIFKGKVKKEKKILTKIILI